MQPMGAQSHTGIKDSVYRQEKALSSSFTPLSHEVFGEADGQKEKPEDEVKAHQDRRK